MDAPFDFSALFRDPSAQSYLSGIESLYRQPQGDYFDPEDPRYQQYVDLASKAPESEQIISEYVSRRPDYNQYKRSKGKMFLGGLLSSIANMGNPAGAAKMMQEFKDAPYVSALRDYQDEGKFVDDRARLADAARNRELGTLKFGLEQSSRAKRYKALDEEKARSLAERTAGKATGFAGKEEDRENKQNQNEVLNSLRQLALQLQQSRLDLSREGLDFRKSQEEWDRTHPRTGKPVDPLKAEVERLENTATIEEAVKDEVVNDPAWSKYFKTAPDGTISIKANLDETTRRSIQSLIKHKLNQRILTLGGGR